MNKPPFLVLGLPRSRTYWLSHFLSCGEWHCGHDEARRMGTLDDVRAWISQENTGTVETAAAPFWRLALRYRPDLRIVTVRRPVAEVAASSTRAGWAPDLDMLRRADAKLDQIEARVPGVVSVAYADLCREDVCARLFEHCLPYTHDHDRWVAFNAANLQINPRALDRYLIAHRRRLLALQNSAKHASLAVLRSRPVSGGQAITLQSETLDAFITDGAGLFARHAAAVGETPVSYLEKNVALARKLEAIGALMITTGRSNGRLFGYLMAVISPSLEAPGLLTATHTLFFAAPEFPGLGLKLQRESVRRLSERGVKKVFFRAGVRGSGDRTSVLYQRMGAHPFGEVYALDLKEI